jgi:hypothetical protein
VIKSKIIRWVGHVARMGRRGVYRVFLGKPDGKNKWGDPRVVGKIILRWILKKKDVWVWSGLGWLRIEEGGGHL